MTMLKRLRIRGWLAGAAVILAVAMPSVAQARLGGSGPWPGDGVCAQLRADHIVKCDPHVSHRRRHHH
jgi:hypothetical protein